ncbi:hypothetical protein IWW36_003218 [Coemansia brasiliensis]|uniref:Uncharacterized protein n=1 Tax=Coemansia brasiliensis TaxID=2650707 RepID=A0A9W8I5M0_9FUNG|nr:hypothetical protein IWW36_003218 [Coemansia brasiliensis]
MASSDEFEEASDYYSAVNSSDDERQASHDNCSATVSETRTVTETQDDSEEEVIEISSMTHGVDPPSTSFPQAMQVMMPGPSGMQSVEMSVVSLTRYTFADPVVASEGPEPLEPSLQTMQLGHENSSRPTGVGRGGQPVMRRRGPDGAAYGEYDDDGLIAEFTEDRCNRRLARIGRQLLLPDSYIEACYDLHEFMETQESGFLAIESVQRNVFKCLKICARLSKLHGYSIQHMWQVIQQAHKHVHEFTPPRAHTIELWNLKLSNRIRMMAVSPAADGSAPQRLPSVPPPELLNAHSRDRLLPLPEINVSALNDRGFNRTKGLSGSSYYLANPIKQQQTAPLVLPPISELDAGPSEFSIPRGLNLPAVSDESRNNQSGIIGALEQRNEYTVEEPASDIFSLTAATSNEAALADSLASTREAELAIIEHQLRELERTPVHRMGPMMRAALNLLVEMRFRLQLGLPRSVQNAENPLTAPLRIPDARGNPRNSESSEAYGDGAMSEERVIEYVLDQISTTRRNQRQQQQQQLVATNNHANVGGGFGAPLYMMPHHAGMFYPGMSNGQTQNTPRNAFQSGPRSELRRRRDGDSSEISDSEESQSGMPIENNLDIDSDAADSSLSHASRRPRSDSTQRTPAPRRSRRRMQQRRRRRN